MISAATAAAAAAAFSGGGGGAAAAFIMGQPSLTSQLTTTQHCNTRDGVFVLFCDCDFDLAFGIWLVGAFGGFTLILLFPPFLP